MTTPKDTPQARPRFSAALTAACRFAPARHNECGGMIWLGSIFGEPTDCSCACHAPG